MTATIESTTSNDLIALRPVDPDDKERKLFARVVNNARDNAIKALKVARVYNDFKDLPGADTLCKVFPMSYSDEASLRWTMVIADAFAYAAATPVVSDMPVFLPPAPLSTLLPTAEVDDEEFDEDDDIDDEFIDEVVYNGKPLSRTKVEADRRRLDALLTHNDREVIAKGEKGVSGEWVIKYLGEELRFDASPGNVNSHSVANNIAQGHLSRQAKSAIKSAPVATAKVDTTKLRAEVSILQSELKSILCSLRMEGSLNVRIDMFLSDCELRSLRTDLDQIDGTAILYHIKTNLAAAKRRTEPIFNRAERLKSLVQV